jgi:hypothetical protein
MKNVLTITLFTLATLAWAAAQQPGDAQGGSSGQATSPSSSGQSQPSTPGSAGQGSSQGQEPSAPVTEGCLGGSNPNYTITDKAGTTYKLNLPPNADGSRLTSQVGESVQVLGDVNSSGKSERLLDQRATHCERHGQLPRERFDKCAAAEAVRQSAAVKLTVIENPGPGPGFF